MTIVKSPVLRYHGGKFRLAPWLLGFFPKHRCYTEAFGGAASVLLQKSRAYAEVYNDLDDDIVNVFRVLQDESHCARLIEKLALTPYARREFELAAVHSPDSVERARRTIIRSLMAFGSAGATQDHPGLCIDTARERGTSMHAWSRYPDVVQNFTSRLQGVLIESRPATEVLRQHDAVDTLHFVDPPYLHKTRSLRQHQSIYRHEMTAWEHEELLECLKSLQGMVVLSGYDSPLYRDILNDWSVYTKRALASGRRGGVMRTEVVWLNPACEAQQAQQSLFTLEGIK